jgi:hypothetical protein
VGVTVLAERAKPLENLSPKGLKVKALRFFLKNWPLQRLCVSTRKRPKYSHRFVDLPFSLFSHENAPLGVSLALLSQRRQTKHSPLRIGSSIIAEHKQAGLVPSRTKRKNHKSTGINLLAVPRYSDLLDDMDAEDESERGRALVTSEAGWRTEMAKWIGDAREAEDESDSDNENLVTPRIRVPQPKSMTLTTLFGGKV